MHKNRIFPFFHMISGPTEGVPHIHAHTPRPGARHCRAIPKLADLCAESRGCAYPQWHICRSSHPRRPSRVNTDQAVPSAMWGHAVAREVQGSARRDAVPLGLLIAPWAVPATWSPGTYRKYKATFHASAPHRSRPACRRGLQPGDARGRRAGLDRHCCWGGTGARAPAALELTVN
jgi:hypothetical protein